MYMVDTVDGIVALEGVPSGGLCGVEGPGTGIAGSRACHTMTVVVLVVVLVAAVAVADTAAGIVVAADMGPCTAVVESKVHIVAARVETEAVAAGLAGLELAPAASLLAGVDGAERREESTVALRGSESLSALSQRALVLRPHLCRGAGDDGDAGESTRVG